MPWSTYLRLAASMKMRDIASVGATELLSSVEMHCEVPTLHDLPEKGWWVNTNHMVPARASSPLYGNYESINGVKPWVVGEHSVAWATAALFKAIYVPAACASTGLYVGVDRCTELLSFRGEDPDAAESH